MNNIAPITEGLAPTGPTPLRAMTGLTAPETLVFKAIHAAIVEQRLLPGTRLTEEELAAIYATSRMRIRRVLLALAHEGVIALPPGRGAQVACPTAEEARAVFEARRLIEAGLIASRTIALDEGVVHRLRACRAAETAAARAHDRGAMIGQSGAFHIELARGLGNPVMADIIANLVARSSLIIALFQRDGAVCCRADDHDRLIETLSGPRPAAAAAMMRAHLASIEAGLEMATKPAPGGDLRTILGGRRGADPVRDA
ncbi:MAG: GntR family transcriptional regulator [Acidiphilium sp.]|nr:GntR family transcriptional regulator [Acidiphilium sp.]